MKNIKILVTISMILIALILLTKSTYAVEQTKFKIEINKVDENGEPLEGAEFGVQNEPRSILVTDIGNGKFQTAEITIETENQEFLFKIEETKTPKGYKGLDAPFYLRVKTGLNYEKTAYIVYQATLEGAEGNEFTGAEVICEKEDDIITVTIPNEKINIFDLALRKFITSVNDDAVTTRIPTVKVDENGKITYEHDKTPVYVANTDLVTYTLRVYNEGNVAGYAMEISDDIPDGLEFLPDNQTNKDFGWVMLDSSGNETTDVSKAVEIRTKYLENTLLKAFDETKTVSTTEPLNPSFADVKVVFKVVEKNITSADRIVTNKAQITKDKAVDENGDEMNIDDIDSVPNKWNEGEDDQDIEKIYVKFFDLSLLKWVTKTILIEDGVTTENETGFTPYDNPDQIAKVAISKKKFDKTTVKFVYNIIIKNEGEIAGYATEITDYIPEGLEFKAEDNPKWVLTSANKITTDQLKDTLLQPGETATIEVTFTWINSESNLGLKRNVAEISQDDNDRDADDIDSTPDNVTQTDYDKQQEDDDDKADVILEIKTGGNVIYIGIVLIPLIVVASGIILIKKFVFKK